MRIKDTSSARDMEKNAGRLSPLKRGMDEIRSLFSSKLDQVETVILTYNQEVETLRKEIEDIGEKLSAEPTVPNFKKFRELLSQLAKRVNTEAYRLEKFGGTAQNPRYYEIITVINSEADRLYNLIIQEQRDNMAITARVISIKGLVVDLIT